jgi:hypothetical protein
MAGEWAAQLGKKRRLRDDAAAQLANTAQEHAAGIAAVARERWCGIADAIRQLVAAYNAGAGHDVLHVVDDREVADRPAIRIASSAADGPFLSARLDGTLICLCARTGDGLSSEVEHRLRADRDDERTAAYVVQNWLERL